MAKEVGNTEKYDVLEEGYDAYCREMYKIDNPYALGSERAELWQDGWKEAQRARKERAPVFYAQSK